MRRHCESFALSSLYSHFLTSRFWMGWRTEYWGSIPRFVLARKVMHELREVAARLLCPTLPGLSDCLWLGSFSILSILATKPLHCRVKWQPLFVALQWGACPQEFLFGKLWNKRNAGWHNHQLHHVHAYWQAMSLCLNWQLVAAQTSPPPDNLSVGPPCSANVHLWQQKEVDYLLV